MSFRDPDHASKDGAWASTLEGDGQWKEEGGEELSMWWQRQRSCRTGLHTTNRKRKDNKTKEKERKKLKNIKAIQRMGGGGGWRQGSYLLSRYSRRRRGVSQGEMRDYL